MAQEARGERHAGPVQRAGRDRDLCQGVRGGRRARQARGLRLAQRPAATTACRPTRRPSRSKTRPGPRPRRSRSKARTSGPWSTAAAKRSSGGWWEVRVLGLSCPRKQASSSREQGERVDGSRLMPPSKAAGSPGPSRARNRQSRMTPAVRKRAIDDCRHRLSRQEGDGRAHGENAARGRGGPLHDGQAVHLHLRAGRARSTPTAGG